MFVRVGSASDLCIAEFLLGMATDALQSWDTVNGVNGQAETINLIIDSQLHWRVDVALLLVPAHMQSLILAAIS